MTVDFSDLEQQNGLPSGLLAAVQQQESGGDPNAVSSAGAVGAFQFEPKTAAQYGIDPTDPDQAAQGAAAMFGDLSKKYNGDLPSMLAAYNWGQGNVDRKGIENAPPETQKYINNILPKLNAGGGKEDQYAAADTGNMTDATVDGNDTTVANAPVATPSMSPSKMDLMLEAESRGILPSDKQALLDEARSRGLIGGAQLQVSLIDALKNSANDPRAAYQTTMNTVAKPINSAVNNVVSPAIGTIASAEAPAAQGIANAIDSTGAGQWIGDKLLGAKDTLSDAGNSFKELESYNPDLAKDLSALGQNAQLAGNVAAIKPLASAVGGMGQTASDALAAGRMSDIPSIVPGGAIPASLIKSSSQNAYKYAHDVGGDLHPDFTNDIMDIIDNARPEPLPGGDYTAEQKALNSSLNDYANMRDQPMSLSQFENFDKSIGAKESAAMDGFKPTNNSRIIGNIQDQVRARLQALQPTDVIGGKEGFDALTQHAIPLWSTQAKMSDLENIINKANSMDNPVTAMRTGFRNLANSPKMAQYPSQVQDLIKSGAKNPSDVLGIIGSRLNPIVAGASGPVGMATEMATSATARGIRNAMQNAKANKVLSAMSDPVRGSVEKFANPIDVPKPILAPSPELQGTSSQYVNPKSKPLTKFSPNGDVNLHGNVEPEAPELQGTSSQYVNPKSKPLTKFSPNGDVNLHGNVEPEAPELQGTESTYFAKGGVVKNREISLTKKLEVKLGRKPKAREVELASYVGAHGVHRLLNQKDVTMPAHKMFPLPVVTQKRELFFNGRKPYSVAQIQKALG